jgi:hypothetical protein
MVVLFIRTDETTNRNASVIALALLSALPYCLEFLGFTFLVFNWAALFHFAMKGGTNPFAKLKTPFLIANLIQFTIIIGLIIALATSSDTATQIDLAKGGTIVIICFGLLLTTAFLAYGHLLAKVLAAGGKETAVRRSIQMATIVFPICFFIESVLSIITVSDFDNFYQDMAVIVAIEYLFDFLSMAALLWIFRKGVTALAPNAGKSLNTVDSTTERSTKGSKSVTTKGRSDTVASTSRHGGTMGSSESNLLDKNATSSTKAIELQNTSSTSNLMASTNPAVTSDTAGADPVKTNSTTVPANTA